MRTYYIIKLNSDGTAYYISMNAKGETPEAALRPLVPFYFSDGDRALVIRQSRAFDGLSISPGDQVLFRVEVPKGGQVKPCGLGVL